MCSEMTLALPMIAHGVGQNLDAAFFNNRYLIGCHLPFTKVAHLLPTQNDSRLIISQAVMELMDSWTNNVNTAC